MRKVLLLIWGLFLLIESRAQNDTVFLAKDWQRQSALVPALSSVYDVQNRPYLYVASRNGGLQIFDVSLSDTALLVKTITTGQFDTLEVMNVYQEGDYLYLALGNFFGSAAQSPGMAIVRVTDPLNPVVTDVWNYGSVQKGASYIAVQGNYAYLSAMSKGIFILNITDKSNITFELEYQPDLNWPVINPNAVQTPNARGMVLKGNVLYLCYDAGGLRVLNVEDKQHPYEISHYLNNGALNKQQAFNYIYLKDDTAFVGADYCGVEILDISDTNNVQQLSWWNPYGCETAGNVWTNSDGHINEVRYDAGEKLLFLSAGASEVVALDVADVMHPKQAGIYAPQNTEAVWGISIHSHEVFAHYINAFVPYFSNWQGMKHFSWTRTADGIVFIENNKALSVYPNPATEALRFSGFKGRAVLHIYNSLGATVRETDISADEELNIAPLPTGYYLAEIKNSAGMLRCRFIKE